VPERAPVGRPLGLAGLCLVLAFVTFAVRTRRRGVAIALVVALAVVIVDPPDHLNSPRADWFGHSLGDGTLGTIRSGTSVWRST